MRRQRVPQARRHLQASRFLFPAERGLERPLRAEVRRWRNPPAAERRLRARRHRGALRGQ